MITLWCQHWVALKVMDADASQAMYFYDKIAMKIRNYEGAANVLELMEQTKENDWIYTHEGRNKSARRFCPSKRPSNIGKNGLWDILTIE